MIASPQPTSPEGDTRYIDHINMEEINEGTISSTTVSGMMRAEESKAYLENEEPNRRRQPPSFSPSKIKIEDNE